MTRFGLFQCGSLHYAISLLQLQKIVQDSATYLLPGLPLAIAAVLVDEGQIVPLLNFELFFGCGVQPDEITPKYQILVDSEYGKVALPGNANGRIVARKRGILSAASGSDEVWIIGTFNYQNIDYNILDINFLALEMTQNFWLNQTDSRGVRRHP